MDEKQPAAWLKSLTAEDLRFIRSFLLASGSLKALAKDYGVSYPTIRARLDRLIARLSSDDEPLDPFRARVKELVSQGGLDPNDARELIRLHSRQMERGEED